MLTHAISIANARPEHAPQIETIMRMVCGCYYTCPCADCMTTAEVAGQIERFPEGQFVALLGDKVVGFAITMLTNRSPRQRPLPWLEMIGGTAMTNHEPDGTWLYGIDFAVHPDYRRRGIGTRMYKVRFQLVQRLNLRGFYAGGMLRGYEKYRGRMSVREYGEKVIHGEIKDPTVTMQINRGFKPRAVIENYAEYEPSANGAMLIEWTNVQYQPSRATA
jgi:GNAT superfamily N-acetyltransferase